MIKGEEVNMKFRDYLKYKGYPIEEGQECSYAIDGVEYEHAIWYARRHERFIYDKAWSVLRAMNALVYAGFRPITKALDNGHIQVWSKKGTQFNYFATTGTIMRSGRTAYACKGMKNLLRLLNEE